MQIAEHYIDGEWVPTGELEQSVNPADGTQIGECRLGSKVLADEAVAALWPFGEKADTLRQLAMVLLERTK